MPQTTAGRSAEQKKTCGRNSNILLVGPLNPPLPWPEPPGHPQSRRRASRDRCRCRCLSTAENRLSLSVPGNPEASHPKASHPKPRTTEIGRNRHGTVGGSTREGMNVLGSAEKLGHSYTGAARRGFRALAASWRLRAQRARPSWPTRAKHPAGTSGPARCPGASGYDRSTTRAFQGKKEARPAATPNIRVSNAYRHGDGKKTLKTYKYRRRSHLPLPNGHTSRKTVKALLVPVLVTFCKQWT